MITNFPQGKRIAVALTLDFDAHSAWIGSFGQTGQGALSRGEYSATVGVPRTLDVLKRLDVSATFFVPLNSARTFPEAFGRIVDAGHEIAAHGVFHEAPGSLDDDEERRSLEQQVDTLEKLSGRRPRGYRAPLGDPSARTLALLEEYEFSYDSSLSGNDYTPYRPRAVVQINPDGANVFGPPSSLLEIPVDLYADDYLELEPVVGIIPGYQSPELMFSRWAEMVDYAAANVPGGVVDLVNHPEVVGRAQHITRYEKFIRHLKDRGDVWFATMSEITDAWED